MLLLFHTVPLRTCRKSGHFPHHWTLAGRLLSLGFSCMAANRIFFITQKVAIIAAKGQKWGECCSCIRFNLTLMRRCKQLHFNEHNSANLISMQLQLQQINSIFFPPFFYICRVLLLLCFLLRRPHQPCSPTWLGCYCLKYYINVNILLLGKRKMKKKKTVGSQRDASHPRCQTGLCHPTRGHQEVVREEVFPTWTFIPPNVHSIDFQ